MTQLKKLCFLLLVLLAFFGGIAIFALIIGYRPIICSATLDMSHVAAFGSCAAAIGSFVVAMFLWWQYSSTAERQEEIQLYITEREEKARIRYEKITLFDKRLEIYNKFNCMCYLIGDGLKINNEKIDALQMKIITTAHPLDTEKGNNIYKHFECFQNVSFLFKLDVAEYLMKWQYSFFRALETQNIERINKFNELHAENMVFMDKMFFTISIYYSTNNEPMTKEMFSKTSSFHNDFIEPEATRMKTSLE